MAGDGDAALHTDMGPPSDASSSGQVEAWLMPAVAHTAPHMARKPLCRQRIVPQASLALVATSRSGVVKPNNLIMSQLNAKWSPTTQQGCCCQQRVDCGRRLRCEHDSHAPQPLVRPLLAVQPRRGPGRRRRANLRADKRYDRDERRRWLREQGITAKIARHAIESSECLGRHRWKIQRTSPGHGLPPPHPTRASPATTPPSPPSPAALTATRGSPHRHALSAQIQPETRTKRQFSASRPRIGSRT